MKDIKKHITNKMEKILTEAPIDDKCPLIDRTIRPKWNCGKFDRGNETFCHNVSGFIKCPHYIKWFNWNIWNLVAKEIAKMKLKQKKKEPKKKCK